MTPLPCAAPAFGRAERDDVVPLLQRRHAGTDIGDDARPLVAENRREDTLGIGTGKRVFVGGVADAGRLDLDHDLACPRAFDVHSLQAERLARLAGHGSTNLHGFLPRD